ncbi:MAG: branched-chain-amino-acid transaminase [Ardenticatenaceae bacterium]|nr:branched-chain-amino-acid transaminase [Ardenticatenaceae bacterium]
MNVVPSYHEFIVYLDGQFLPETQAKLSIFDHAVLYGDAVFDTCCAWAGAVFKLDAHLDRLYESAKAILLDIPITKADLRSVVLETIRQNQLREAYVKILVTRGVGELPILRPINCRPSVIVFARPYGAAVGSGDKAHGQTAKITATRRIPAEALDPKIKSCNYLNHVLAYLEAQAAGCDHAIELDLQGAVCEAPGFNVFMVKRRGLATPADNILVGITRQTVCELAVRLGCRVIETRLTAFDLYNADEVFLSGTAGGIVPIVQIDGRTIGSGETGPITQAIIRAYYALLESGEQSTPVYGR